MSGKEGFAAMNTPEGQHHNRVAAIIVAVSSLVALVLDMVWFIGARSFSVKQKVLDGVQASDYNNTDSVWTLLLLVVVCTFLLFLTALARLSPSYDKKCATYLFSSMVSIVGLYNVATLTVVYAYTLTTLGHFNDAYKDGKGMGWVLRNNRIPTAAYFITLAFMGGQAAYTYPTVPMVRHTVV